MKVGYLRGLLDYDPSTGVLTWKVSPRANVKAGDRAGSIDGNGYRLVMIDQKAYRASRLIWFYITGAWPTGVIDHKDRNKANDAWINFRHVSQGVNSQNRSVGKNNKSGVRGIYWNNTIKKWHVQIAIDGKRIHLGIFHLHQFHLATIARQQAEKKYFVALEV